MIVYIVTHYVLVHGSDGGGSEQMIDDVYLDKDAAENAAKCFGGQVHEREVFEASADRKLASTIVRRLNALLDEDARVRGVLTTILTTRWGVPESLTENHPTLQFRDNTIGLLGLLNGICGADSHGLGHIAAYLSNGYLCGFILRGPGKVGQ